MSRVSKFKALQLIPYIKKIDIHANFWDPTAKSAFEFGRQMSSKKLKKQNPTYECEIHRHKLSDPPKLIVTYTNDTKWETLLSELKLDEIRAIMFEKAEEVEFIFDQEDN
jgi:hypothetical protein